MDAELDMNSNQIINLPEPSSFNSPVRLQDLTDAQLDPLDSTLLALKSLENVTVTQDGTGAVARPALTKFRDNWHIKDFLDPSRAVHESFNLAFQAVGEDDTYAAKILSLDPVFYDIEDTIVMGDGDDLTQPSLYHGITVQGVGGSQERLRRAIELSGKMSTIRWQGDLAGRMWDIRGPTAGMSILDVFLEGNTNRVAEGELTPAGADYLLRVKSLQGGKLRLHGGGGRNTLFEFNTSSIPNDVIDDFDGYAARGTTLNDIWINFDANEYVDGYGVTGVLIDGQGNLVPDPDPCKNVFSIWGYVNQTVNPLLTDTCPDFVSGQRGGIGLDIRFADSNVFRNLWFQSAGTDTGVGTSIMLRGRRIPDLSTGAVYPIHNDFGTKWQAGQGLPLRVDNSQHMPAGANTFGTQEVDGETAPTWPVNVVASGTKPESVTEPAPINYISRWGLQHLRDEDRNQILNSGYIRAFYNAGPITIANGPSNKLFDANQWFEFDGSVTGTVTRLQPTLGQTEVPFGPAFGIRINVTAASGNTGFAFVNAVENLLKFGGRKCNYSAFMKATSNISTDIRIAQVFGTGGAPSAPVVVNSTQGIQTVTTTMKRLRWQFDQPSLTGKTLGSNLDHYNKVSMALPLNAAFTLDIWIPQFELGESDTPWFQRQIPDEQALLDRYVQIIDAPNNTYGFGYVVDANTVELVHAYRSNMRTSPSLVVRGVAADFLVNGVACTAVPTLSGNARRGVLTFTRAAHGLPVGSTTRLTTNGTGTLYASAEFS